MTLTTRFLTVLFLSSVCALLGCNQQKTPPSPTAVTATANYGQVPLSFEANHGQAHEPVKFLARGTNATLYLTPAEAALEVRNAE